MTGFENHSTLKTIWNKNKYPFDISEQVKLFYCNKCKYSKDKLKKEDSYLCKHYQMKVYLGKNDYGSCANFKNWR